jgi:hypothetical protein
MANENYTAFLPGYAKYVGRIGVRRRSMRREISACGARGWGGRTGGGRCPTAPNVSTGNLTVTVNAVPVAAADSYQVA